MSIDIIKVDDKGSILKSIRNAIMGRPADPVIPGLYTYQISPVSGGKKRLHLRVNAGGDGILFVDVTDVIHLNKAACEIAKLLLDGAPQDQVISVIRSKYRGDLRGIQSDVVRIAQILNHFENHTDLCNTCGISNLMDDVPIFSMPIESPYKIDVALTYGCNNQCPHCYNEANRFSMPSLMLEDWERVFDKVADLGIPHVILTGGEATLHPDFLDIVRYADQKGMIVGLNSNGRYLSHRPFIESAAQAGLNHVQVTLGSCYADVHNEMMGADSFGQTVRGITTAIESGVHVITNTTMMASNIGRVEELIDFIYDLGIRTFAMNGMIYSGGGYSNPGAIRSDKMEALIAYVQFLAEERGMRFMWYTPTEYCMLSPLSLDVGIKKCNAAEYSVCIEPNGDLLPCQSYYVSAGNILDDAWEDVWDSELFRSFREREDTQMEVMLPEMCWNCPDLYVCGGGCRIERDAQNGIRVAETAGGGCVGCSNFNTKLVQIEHIDAGSPKPDWRDRDREFGYVPFPSQSSTARRSTGEK